MHRPLLAFSLTLLLTSGATAAEPFWPPRQDLPPGFRPPVSQPFRGSLPVAQHCAPPRSVIVPVQYAVPQHPQPAQPQSSQPFGGYQQQQQQQFAPGQTTFFYGSSPIRPEPSPQLMPPQQSWQGPQQPDSQQPAAAQDPNAATVAMPGDPQAAATSVADQKATDRNRAASVSDSTPAPRLRQGEMLPSGQQQQQLQEQQRQLDPRVSDYFQRLRGPSLSNHNQNQQGHSFYGQNHYRQATVAPPTGGLQTRHNISSPNTSTHNMSRAGFNQNNYSLHNIQTRERGEQRR